MTLQKRLEKLENVKAREEQFKIEEAERKEKERREYVARVRELNSRIGDILTVANKCKELGMQFPSESNVRQFGYGEGKWGFVADGFYHHVGFERTKNEKRIAFLKIENGGYCGPYDFYVNESEMFLLHESNDTEKAPDVANMKQFLKEFDSFEAAFYKWIDSMEV